MNAEDIILKVVADTMQWWENESKPSIRGYEKKWVASGHWNHVIWRKFLAESVHAVRKLHGHNFQAASMRRKLVTK